MPAPRQRLSPYMHFAKLHADARFNLAASGVPGCELSDLAPELAGLRLHGPNAYGYPLVREAIAERFGVKVGEVVTAEGASMANHLALAALVEPGDEVVLEEPTYELIASTLLYLGAELKRAARRPEAGWRLEPEAFAEAIGPRTRLVVLTNLHNPTSARDDLAAVRRVAEAAERVGAIVLVDEVYLELTFGDGPARTCFTDAPNVAVTSSLTKAYGLSGLRCGWILARPHLAERVWRLVDLYYSVAPFLTDQLSALALQRLPGLRRRAEALLEPNRQAYREILGDSPALDQVISDVGTTVFPRLRAGEVDALCRRLRERFETSVVPGSFFERPDHIRVGLAGDPAVMREGYARLAQALSG